MGAAIIDSDRINVAALQRRRVAIIGYGNQGRAQALNLRDSGVQVLVGQRPGRGFEQAAQDGFEPGPLEQAVRSADLVILTLPDSAAPQIYDRELAGALHSGQALGFVHGYNLHYGHIVPPAGLDVIMVAPKGAGYMLRQAFQGGSGLPCLVAVHHDATGQAWPIALAWAAGLGSGRSIVLESSVAEETETDLFGEQAAVVGGVTAVMHAAFDTLIEAGYSPEHAYLECVHEVKFVVDLIHDHGFSGMRERISDTARFGGWTRQPRLVAALMPVLKTMLAEIRAGSFAEEWAAEHRQELGRMESLFEADRASLLESTGRRLRQVRAGATENSPILDPNPTASASKRGIHVPSDTFRRI